MLLLLGFHVCFGLIPGLLSMLVGRVTALDVTCSYVHIPQLSNLELTFTFELCSNCVFVIKVLCGQLNLAFFYEMGSCLHVHVLIGAFTFYFVRSLTTLQQMVLSSRNVTVSAGNFHGEYPAKVNIKNLNKPRCYQSSVVNHFYKQYLNSALPMGLHQAS